MPLIDFEEEIARRKAVKDARLAAEDPGTTAQALDGVIATLAAVRRGSAQFEEEFNARIDNMDDVQCPEHPETSLGIDRERSLRESFEARRDDPKSQFVIRLHPCRQCGEEINKAELATKLERMSVPGDLHHCTLNNWVPKDDIAGAQLVRVQEYAKTPRGTLVIIGPRWGNGKSHLAVGVLAANPKGTFITQNTFIATLRAEYDKGRKRIVAALQATPLLVLDDIGLVVEGKDALPALHEVLTSRYGNRLPTIITGNFEKVDELKEYLGPRMYDRLRGSIFACLTIVGESQRAKQRESYLDKSHPET